MMDQLKIAAVFASYNRKEMALECVRRLQRQSRQVDLVVVADNASGDGSREALKELKWERLLVINTGDNLGNAGAVEIAMDRAFAEGMGAVWILDDDSWPRPDALENALSDGYDENVVVGPVQIDPATKNFTWPLQLIDETGELRMMDSVVDLPMSGRLQVIGTWTGAIIPRKVWQTVGSVRGDLFIRGEDEEYPWRIRQAGFRQEIAVKMILDHSGPAELVEMKFLGKRLFLEPNLSDFKLYYKVRSMVWLKRRQNGIIGALAMAAAYLWGIGRVDGAQRWGLCLEAAWHGWRGQLGRHG